MNSTELLQLAFEARSRAYAPYSGYLVGAAVQGEDGEVFSGCNIENVSYGATVCGERVALFSMVATGCLRLRRVAVATRDGGTPCGICLQALLEFSPDPKQVEVVVGGEDGSVRSFTLAQLLPFGFRSPEVNRTE
jgi:cytidine deaminase